MSEDQQSHDQRGNQGLNEHGLNENWKQWNEIECETILENNPFDNYARFRLSQIWINEGFNMDDAIKLLESVMKSDAEFMYAEIKMLFGDRMASPAHNDYNKAIEFYLEAAEHLPTSADVFIKLGLCYEKLREFDDAIKYFKKALRRDKTAFKPLFRLGLVFIRNNLKEKGLKHLL